MPLSGKAKVDGEKRRSALKRDQRRASLPDRVCPGFEASCGAVLPKHVPAGQRGRLPERCPGCSTRKASAQAAAYRQAHRGDRKETCGVYPSNDRVRDELFKVIVSAGTLSQAGAVDWGSEKGIAERHLLWHLDRMEEQGDVRLTSAGWVSGI